MTLRRGLAFLRFIQRGGLLVLAAAWLGWPAPGRAAVLSASFDLLPPDANTDLTSEGRLDWEDWGFFTETTVTRKYGLAAQIAYRPITTSRFDGPYWLDNAGDGFTWSDGTPTLAATSISHGIFFIGVENGFEIRCPADTDLKTLKVYLGIDGAVGRFTAHLSGSGLPGITNNLYANPASGSNAVFSVDFQAASAGEILTVAFVMETGLIPDADVILQAATLTSTSLPPAVAMIAPADGAVFTAPASIQLQAAAADGAGSITNLDILSGTKLVDRAAATSLSVMLSNQPAGNYVFTAIATDTRGLSVTSPPVNVYVATGGGALAGLRATPPSTVDLTAEGTTDWAHWGLFSSTDLDHKSNIAGQITNVSLVTGSSTNLNQYGDNLTGYSWTDGTPTLSAVETHTGIFALTVPAGTVPKRLKVYVGIYGAQGRLEAALSDGSGPPYYDSSLASAYNNAYAVYTLTFSSREPAANLEVRWTSTTLFDSAYGNVTWQAAALAPTTFLIAASNIVVPSGAPWAFTLPSAVGFCLASPTITEVGTVTNIGCGSNFSVTRSWQATDGCGNWAGCSQTATVLDTNPPSLKIVSAQPDSPFALSFCTRPYSTYRVLYSESLAPPNWQDLTNLPGSGAEALVTLPNAPAMQLFFRVKVE